MNAVRDGKLWVLSADEAVAHLLRLPGYGQELQPVKTITDAAAHADEGDLRRDAQGRRAGGGRSVGTVTTSAGESETHKEAAAFAARVAEWVAEEHRAGNFTELKIAAAPRFLGLLRKALPAQVLKAVVDDTPHDYARLTAAELTQRLFPSDDRKTSGPDAGR